MAKFTLFAFLLTQLAWALPVSAQDALRQEPIPEAAGLEQLKAELQGEEKSALASEIASPAAGLEAQDEAWPGFISPYEFERILWLMDLLIQKNLGYKIEHESITVDDVISTLESFLNEYQVGPPAFEGVQYEKVSAVVQNLPFLLTGQSQPASNELPTGFELSGHLGFLRLLSGFVHKLWDEARIRREMTPRRMSNEILAELAEIVLSNAMRKSKPGSDLDAVLVGDFLVSAEAQKRLTLWTMEFLTRPYSTAGLEEARLRGAVDRLAEIAERNAGVLVITQSGLGEHPELIRLARHPEFAKRMILFGAVATAAQLAQLRELGVRVIEENDFNGLVIALLSMEKADRVNVLEEASILTQALAKVLPPSMRVIHIAIGAQIKAILSAFIPDEELDKLDPEVLGTLARLTAA